MKCAQCKKEKANRGSIKLPYCKKCFQKQFGNNYARYDEYVLSHHLE